MTMTIADLLSFDSAGMLDAVHTLPAQLHDGFARTADVREVIARSWPPATHGGVATPRTLVVCGMGGSGVGADLLPAVADLDAPVVAVKGYELPAWVNDTDRVICVSYSGGTAETLACFEQAAARSVVAAVITTGGELATKATALGVPIVEMPVGMQPRAAVGVLFGALVGVASSLNVIRHPERVIEEAAAGAQSVVELHTGAEEEPPALVFAREIGDATVVIYGAGMTAPVAWRWKAQINENSKMPAFANVYPELDHNEIVGWERATSGDAQWALVELLPAGAASNILDRFDITGEIIADELSARLRLEPLATTAAGAVFELLAWGDYLSTYLALIHGVDPTPVDRIRQLKERLAGA